MVYSRTIYVLVLDHWDQHSEAEKGFVLSSTSFSPHRASRIQSCKKPSLECGRAIWALPRVAVLHLLADKICRSDSESQRDDTNCFLMSTSRLAPKRTTKDSFVRLPEMGRPSFQMIETRKTLLSGTIWCLAVILSCSSFCISFAYFLPW